MRSLSPGLHPPVFLFNAPQFKTSKKTGFIDKKELILLLATPIFKNLRSINVGECRRQFFTLMFMSENFKREKKRVDEKRAKKKGSLNANNKQ